LIKICPMGIEKFSVKAFDKKLRRVN
jgi:hypothetical protein